MSSQRGTWIFIIYIVFFAWLDWILHRDPVFIIVVGGGLIAAAVNRSRIAANVAASQSAFANWVRSLTASWGRIPERFQRLLLALTPLLYFILRGQGTSGAGFAVALAGAIIAAVVIFLGPAMDAKLQGFYAARNRILNRTVRLLLAPVIGILIAFLIVHGSLLDLPALFGGATESPQSPADMTGQFFIATLLAGGFTVLLVRDAGGQA